MWIQLKSIKRVLVQGINKTYHPGDWVDVGKQIARRWIADGAAWDPNAEAIGDFSEDAGILVLSEKGLLPLTLGHLNSQKGTSVCMPWKQTLIWNPSCPLQSCLVPIGFGFLDVWDIAVPLWDYRVLARAVGTDEERAQTEAVIRDMRVPLYDTRIIFIRRKEITKRLLAVWADEEVEEGDTKLAFLRALYKVKPLILALPITWGDKGGVTV